MPDGTGERLADEILARSAKDGDAAAFEELFHRYKKALLNFVYRLIGNAQTAEEVTQEVFMRAYASLHIYDPGKKFATWIYTIARNLAKNSLRDKKYFRDISLEAPIAGEDETIRLKDVIADTNIGPDAIAADNEFEAEAQKIIDSLPAEYREIIILCSVQDLPHKDVAAILGCSMANVSLKLKKAKELFIEKLRLLENEP